jgi:hypothetical protein
MMRSLEVTEVTGVQNRGEGTEEKEKGRNFLLT